MQGILYDDATETTVGRFLARSLSNLQMTQLAFNDRRHTGNNNNSASRVAFYNQLDTRTILFEAIHNRMSQARMHRNPNHRMVPVADNYITNIKKMLTDPTSRRLFPDDQFWALMPGPLMANRKMDPVEITAFNTNFLSPLLFETFRGLQRNRNAHRNPNTGAVDQNALDAAAQAHSTAPHILRNHRTPLVTGLKLMGTHPAHPVTSLRFASAALAEANVRPALTQIAATELDGMYSRRRLAISEGTTALNVP